MSKLNILCDLCIRHLLDHEWIDYHLLAGYSNRWIPAMICTILHDFDHASIQSKRKEVASQLVATNPSHYPIGYSNQTPTDCDSSTWLLRCLLSIGVSPPDHLYEYIYNHSAGLGYSTYTQIDGIHRYIGLDQASCCGWLSAHDCVTINVRSAIEYGAHDALLQDSFTPYWWADPIIPILLCVNKPISISTLKKLQSRRTNLILPGRWERFRRYSDLLLSMLMSGSHNHEILYAEPKEVFNDFGCIMQLPMPNCVSTLNQDLLWDYGGIMQGARVVDVNRIVSAALFLKVYSDVI